MPSRPAATEAVLRIGELSRRVGVTDHVLRAWERRYAVLRPVRTAAGYRLYSEADERRVRRMQEHLAGGMSAAEAARAALGEEEASADGAGADGAGADGAGADGASAAEPGTGVRELPELARALALSLDGLDEPGAQAALDRLLADFTVETVLREVILPYLRELGRRWEDGETTVPREHFASHILRGRLASLARGWGNGHGPCAMLACPPGEQHDIPLLAFGIVLHRSGWRVDYIGADTPVGDLAGVAAETQPDLAVLAATTPERFAGLTADLARLAAIVPLALAGAGASAALASATGARVMVGDPVTEAQSLVPPARHRTPARPIATGGDPAIKPRPAIKPGIMDSVAD
jgi:MerR family transcriptional regulator, light-induced transcriptional regulator